MPDKWDENFNLSKIFLKLYSHVSKWHAHTHTHIHTHTPHTHTLTYTRTHARTHAHAHARTRAPAHAHEKHMSGQVGLCNSAHATHCCVYLPTKCPTNVLRSRKSPFYLFNPCAPAMLPCPSVSASMLCTSSDGWSWPHGCWLTVRALHWKLLLHKLHPAMSACHPLPLLNQPMLELRLSLWRSLLMPLALKLGGTSRTQFLHV